MCFSFSHIPKGGQGLEERDGMDLLKLEVVMYEYTVGDVAGAAGEIPPNTSEKKGARIGCDRRREQGRQKEGGVCKD